MAKRVALVPEELVSNYYHSQKPETRLENDMESLLESSKLPDDMKAKLLGQMITRYHRIVHTPPEPVRVSITNDSLDNKIIPKDISNTVENNILQHILSSTPQRYSKFIPLIVEKLKTRQYGWNESGEMTENNEPIRGSNIVDFFSYTMRNSKSLHEPKYYSTFLKAIDEIKIPRTWIGNKNVLKHYAVDNQKIIKTNSISPQNARKKKKKKHNHIRVRDRSDDESDRYMRGSGNAPPNSQWLTF